MSAYVKNIFPPNWKNPKPAPFYDLVIIGAGPGGMTAAMAALHLQAKVAIVERAHFGGECLNVGCIPSKALLRSSRLASEIRNAKEWGIKVPKGWSVDFDAIMQRVRRLRSAISSVDAVAEFQKMGADVFLGEAHFYSPNQVEVQGKKLSFKKALIATGTQPQVLDVPGLKEGDYLTNQNVFDLTVLPKRLLVIGGGPISCEMAQAFLRLGSEVTLLTRGKTLLPKEDPLVSDLLCTTFEKEGMQLLFNATPARFERKGKEKILYLNSQKKGIRADALLVSIGRRPAVAGLRLEHAGVHLDEHTGIAVNDELMTSNPNIYAIDTSPRYNFTHMSIDLAKIAVHNALLDAHTKSSTLIIPWCTYTDPEVAHIGMTQKQAEEKGIACEMFTVNLKENPRAILDSEALGFIQVCVQKGTDRILGATVIARHAGDMVSEISVAIASGKGLSAMAQGIHPFPTQGEIMRTVAIAGLQALLKKSARAT